MNEATIGAAVAPAAGPVPLLALPWTEGANEPLTTRGLDADGRRWLADVARRGDMRGQRDETWWLYPPGGSVERVVLVGIGKDGDLPGEERWRRYAGAALAAARRVRAPALALALPDGAGADAQQAAAEGAELARYRFAEFKKPEDESPPSAVTLLVDTPDAAAVERGRIVAAAANWARRLGDLPPNVLTPERMAEEAANMAQARGLRVTVLGPEAMRRETMGGLLAVAQGSTHEPRLVLAEYWGAGGDAAPLVLVGKGITFDSGGLSLKPAANMEEMKFDMAGAAAVLAALAAVCDLGLPVNVVAVTPLAENLPSGSAFRPGDILRTFAGVTVEVVNTDAEGRLILADALAYARSRYRPAAMVDAATLTGACVVALGHAAAGLVGTDAALVEELRRAGDRSGERAWPLPLYEEYREQIRSDVADIKNSGGRAAGALTAAAFLREFVGDTPWAHLDIAGVAWGDGKVSYLAKGATGAPTRLLIEWVRARAGVAQG